MFWKRRGEAFRNPETENRRLKTAVCYVDPDESCVLARRMTELHICEAFPLLTDTAKDAVPICQREKPDLLILEAMPDAMEKLDDPEKDIAGRCELSARIREELPGCRVYLVCAEEFLHLEPVMKKAVETQLVNGYCFGRLTKQQLEAWLSETER